MEAEGVVQIVIPDHITTVRLTIPNRRILQEGMVKISDVLLDYNVKRPGRIVFLTPEQYEMYKSGAYKIRIYHASAYMPVYMEDTGLYEYHLIEGCGVEF